MSVYGYVRISSKDQKPNGQLDALIERGLNRSSIYIDRESGKDFNRPKYKELLKRIRRKDCIVIKSIDRLGRNYGEILKQWGIITKDKGADIEVLDMPLLNTGINKNGLTGRFISDLVLQILAYVAETERTMIKQRQKEGIASAKLRGIQFGRPRARETELFIDAYQRWVARELSSREAAKYAGMSHSTFYRRCRELLQHHKSGQEGAPVLNGRQ